MVAGFPLTPLAKEYLLNEDRHQAIGYSSLLTWFFPMILMAHWKRMRRYGGNLTNLCII